jgi:hypothetical protein
VVKISSDFLFTNPPDGYHFILGLNYAPVYSYDWTLSGWYWGVYGNRASAFIIGNFANEKPGRTPVSCNRQGAFEAIYQVPNTWGDWYWGVSGANGLPANNVTDCINFVSYGPNAAGEHEVIVAFSAGYDGSASVSFAPPSGSPLTFGGNTDWRSWFEARTASGSNPGSVPRHYSIALGALGAIPPGQHVTVQVLSTAGY